MDVQSYQSTKYKVIIIVLNNNNENLIISYKEWIIKIWKIIILNNRKYIGHNNYHHISLCGRSDYLLWINFVIVQYIEWIHPSWKHRECLTTIRNAAFKHWKKQNSLGILPFKNYVTLVTQSVNKIFVLFFIPQGMKYHVCLCQYFVFNLNFCSLYHKQPHFQYYLTIVIHEFKIKNILIIFYKSNHL